jgi:hypothetical protein
MFTRPAIASIVSPTATALRKGAKGRRHAGRFNSPWSAPVATASGRRVAVLARAPQPLDQPDFTPSL